MNLTLVEGRLAVCRLAADSELPSWAISGRGFLSLTRTADEWSVVCAEQAVPPGIVRESGWRLLKVEGPLDFALTGILFSIAQPLSKAGVSIFALSTYDTDYVMVKEDRLPKAVEALESAGHILFRPPA
ncbi:MAG TPA: ACT domain-containing protein [Bryobacteraceae bacterium]